MNTTICIRGREFTITNETKVVLGREEVVYTLNGPKGASYYTMRTRSDLTLMFVCNHRSFGIASTMKGVWITDKNGKLEVVKQ